jgi:hypothetical protein
MARIGARRGVDPFHPVHPLFLGEESIWPHVLDPLFAAVARKGVGGFKVRGQALLAGRPCPRSDTRPYRRLSFFSPAVFALPGPTRRRTPS